MATNNLELANLIEGFRLSCQTEGKSARTVEWYMCFLARFRRFLELSEMPTDVSQVDKNHIRAFVRYLQTRARSLAPIAREVTYGYSAFELVI